MTLSVKTGFGANTNVKSSVVSSEHIPFHIISDNTGNPILVATETTASNVLSRLNAVANDSTLFTAIARTNALVSIVAQDATAQTTLARTNALISFAAQDATAQTLLSRVNLVVANVSTEASLQNVVARLYSLENTMVSGIIATGTPGDPGTEMLSVQGAPQMTPLKVGGLTFAVSNSFTRPADTTQYTIGDMVASSTTNTSVVFPRFDIGRDLGESGVITKVRFFKNDNDLTNASFRIHLYSTAPTPNRGDNLGWQTNYANAYMDSIDVTFDKSFLDGTSVLKTTEIPFKFADTSNSVWAVVEARGAYTPISSGVFTITLYGYQD